MRKEPERQQRLLRIAERLREELRAARLLRCWMAKPPSCRW